MFVRADLVRQAKFLKLKTSIAIHAQAYSRFASTSGRTCWSACYRSELIAAIDLLVTGI